MIITFGLISNSEWENLSPEEALNKLPDRSLSVEFVLSTAVKSSDAFDQVRAELKRIPVSYLRSRALIDPYLFAGIIVEDDRSEPANNFAPISRESVGGQAGLRGRLPTGTDLQLRTTHERSEVDFATSSLDPYHLNRFELSASQSLLKDAFGSGTRALMRSGSFGSRAAMEAVKVQGENLLLQFIRLYLDAWLAQRRVETARESLERRRRLKRAVDVRFKRGNAVKSESLQIDSAVLSSEVELMNAEKSLQETWRALVIGLKLPTSFLKIDPVKIPVKLDSSIEEASKLCSDLSETDVLERSNEVKAANLVAEAQKASSDYAKSISLWDVKANAKVAAQNREESFGGALGDTSSFKHRDWSVGVELQLPFFSFRERAEREEAKANAMRAQAQESLARSSTRIRWANSCSGLTIVKKEIESFKEAVKKQAARESFERERYQIGNTSVFNVVSAGDDLAFSEHSLRQAEVIGRLGAWEVLVLSGELISKFEDQLK